MSSAINHDKLSHLQCIILPGHGKFCHPSFKKHYNEAFLCWHNTLKSGFLSEGLTKEADTLTSDDFLRHDEIFCLFDNDKIVGLFPFTWFDLSFPANYKHSYFLRYPEQALQRLAREQHKLLMTIGTLCVVPQWRKAIAGAGVSEILVSLMIKRYLQSPASLLLLYTRNARKTNELGYRHGGQAWVEDCLVYNMPSDVIAFYRHKVHLSSIKSIPSITEQIWQRKIDAISLNRLGMDRMDEQMKRLA